MSDNKPIIDTSWELKWRRTLRKKLLNCLVLIENHGKPTQELMYELRLAKDALTYWNSDTALWEKHQMVIPTTAPVPQTELQKPEVSIVGLFDIYVLLVEYLCYSMITCRCQLAYQVQLTSHLSYLYLSTH